LERDESRGDTPSNPSGQRGLLRLMLRLPSIRGKLQILSGQSTVLAALCEAYGEASATLERLEKGQLTPEDDLLAEYRAICSEIEADVIRYCVDHE
jgi:hypothetical protein